MRFAGLLRGSPTAVTRAKTVDVEVPAAAEIVLEGEVPPRERRMEGPFGDHFGHYSHAGPFPVFRVGRVTRRRSPIYHGIVVGKPPQEDWFLGDATQAILGPLIRLPHPEVRDVWAYYETGYHGLLVASVEQRYGREAKKAALGILGEGQLSLTKVLVVVDHDVDARDFGRVLAALRANFDPAEDVLLLPGVPFDTLDFTSTKLNVGSKLILDATRPKRSAAGEPPEDSAVGAGTGSSAAAADAAAAWRPREIDSRVRGHHVHGGVLGVAQVASGGREVAEKLARAETGPAIVAVVSEDVDPADRTSALWGVFTRFDPARDLVFTQTELHGAWPVYRGRMAIDATWKPGYPNPISMTDEIVERVTRRWSEYGIPVDPETG
jgi:4-hydroxy-3-polyprenylbenzoate decarboxylase